MANDYIKTLSLNWPAGMQSKYGEIPASIVPSVSKGHASGEFSTESDVERFTEAASKGNLKQLLHFTTHMVVDCKNANGQTPLIAAAIGGHPKAVFFLLAKGANPTIFDGTGNSALHHAAMLEHLDVIDKLVERCDPNLKNQSGQSVIHIAVKENKHGTLENLMKIKTINLDEQDVDGNTAAHLAISTRNLKLLTKLAKMPIDLSIHNRDGMNPLNLAVEMDDIEALKVLLDSKCGIEMLTMRTMYGESNLEIAIRQRHTTIIAYLFNANMHPEKMISSEIDNKYGFTALHWSVLQFDMNLVHKILQINHKLLNVKDKWGKTPLDHVCSIHGFEEGVKENIIDMGIKLIVDGSDMNLIQNKDELFDLIKDTFQFKLKF